MLRQRQGRQSASTDGSTHYCCRRRSWCSSCNWYDAHQPQHLLKPRQKTSLEEEEHPSWVPVGHTFTHKGISRYTMKQPWMICCWIKMCSLECVYSQQSNHNQQVDMYHMWGLIIYWVKSVFGPHTHIPVMHCEASATTIHSQVTHTTYGNNIVQCKYVLRQRNNG